MCIDNIFTWTNGIICGLIIYVVNTFIRTAHADVATLQFALEGISQYKPIACVNNVTWFYLLLLFVPLGYSLCFGFLFRIIRIIIRRLSSFPLNHHG